MNEGIEVLTLEDIAKLDLDVKKPRGKSKKNPNVENREMDTWFNLHLTFGFCENPNCEDARPRKVAEGNAMVARIKEKNMCRICFLAGWLK